MNTNPLTNLVNWAEESLGAKSLAGSDPQGLPERAHYLALVGIDTKAARYEAGQPVPDAIALAAPWLLENNLIKKVGD